MIRMGERMDNVAKEKLVPVIKREWCKACGLCFDYCPRKVFDKDALGNPAVKYPEQCVACYMCQYRCPDFAIALVPAEG